MVLKLTNYLKGENERSSHYAVKDTEAETH